MAVPRLLLDTLEDLRTDDFEKFKWNLNINVLEGCKPIPTSRLEGSSRTDTVRKMIESYSEDKSVNITVEILKIMRNNHAAEKLKNRYAAGLTTNTSAVAPSAAPVAPPAAPVAPPAAPATMLAQQGSVIISPTVVGGTSGAWNITINK